MKSSKLFLFLVTAITILYAAAANAARVDMKDPRRLIGREGDIRIDAQILQDTVSPNSPITVTYQVHNLSSTAVAVATRVSDCSYDSETGTITLSIGSEIPMDGNLPQLVFIAPGEKKTFTSGAVFNAIIPAIRSPWMNVPRLVQVKVNVLRDLDPFAELISQAAARGAHQEIALSDELFEHWIESNDAILLNTVPVRYNPRGTHRGIDVQQGASAAWGGM